LDGYYPASLNLKEVPVYCNCVKFHQYRFSCLGGVVLTRRMDRQKDRWTQWFLFSLKQTLVVGV